MERGARVAGEFFADRLSRHQRCVPFGTVDCVVIEVSRGLPVPMDEAEEAGLHSSAKAIQRAVRALGF
jgi:hypothetical protein